MTLVRHCVGDGPVGGILVVGDKPSIDDVNSGKPFLSPSGKTLRRYVAELNLKTVRFENVCENATDVLYHDKKESLPTEIHRKWIEDLLKRVSFIKPTVIVALGETALRALTNYSDIHKVHCYVLKNGPVSVPVIPAYHPKMLLQQQNYSYWLKFALNKAHEVSQGKTDPEFTMRVSNDALSAKVFLQNAMKSKEISIDIETIKGQDVLTAIAVCHSGSPNEVLSISNTLDDIISMKDWNEILEQIRVIMADPRILKIGQNFLFDALMLKRIYGMECNGPVWDTMHAANVIYSDLKKSLEDQGRLWTYMSPWKGHWNTTGEKLRIYNAQDTILTYRIAQAQRAKMKELNILDYFQNTPMKLWHAAYELSLRGIKVDTEFKQSLKEKVVEALKEPCVQASAFAVDKVPPGQKKKKKRDEPKDILVQGTFDSIPVKERKNYYIAKKKHEKTGKTLGNLYQKSWKTEIDLYNRPFNPKSPSQVEGVLRNAGVKIPKVKQSHTKEWAESTNEKALQKILKRNTDTEEVLQFVRSILILRQGYKLVSSYCDAALDADNRWRCHYNIEGTETGRSSTKKTSWGTGGNNQNMPRGSFMGVKFKDVFIADDGYTLFQSDQTQAEARVVAYLANCPALIKLMEDGEDIHTYTMNNILGMDITQMPNFKYLRQAGKFVNHGGNYDMGPSTLCEQALNEGVDISVEKAKFFLAERKRVYPEIYEWHQEIQEILKKSRTLWTPFGRRRFFMGMLDNNIFREAYAHIPQSTIPHITNLMWNWVEEQKLPYVQVLQHGHDALLMQIKNDMIDQFIPKFLKQTKAIKFKVKGVEINIPWDAQTGIRWGSLEKWKGI